MIEEDTHLVDRWRVRPNRVEGAHDVLPILSAARVRAERGRHEGQHAAYTVVAHRTNGVLEEWVPIAIAEVHPHRVATLGECRLESRGKRSILRIDRADTTKVMVVLGDAQQPLAWYVAPARGILEKGQDVLGTFRTSIGNEEDCVVVRCLRRV